MEEGGDGGTVPSAYSAEQFVEFSFHQVELADDAQGAPYPDPSTMLAWVFNAHAAIDSRLREHGPNTGRLADLSPSLADRTGISIDPATTAMDAAELWKGLTGQPRDLLVLAFILQGELPVRLWTPWLVIVRFALDTEAQSLGRWWA